MSVLPAWLRFGSSTILTTQPTITTDPDEAYVSSSSSPSSSQASIAIVEKADIINSQIADAKAEKAQCIVHTVVDTHSKLLELPHLRPDPVINQLLGNLVSVCSEIHDQEIVNNVLNNPNLLAVLPSLRQICAESESCLELHWAEHILQGGGSNRDSPSEVLDRLRSFPYYANYQDLTRLELCSILSATPTPPKRIAFLGSGPLPLTSLCLLNSLRNDTHPLLHSSSSSSPTDSTAGDQEEDPIVLNIDNDPAAISASMSLSLALGPHAKGMQFICADAGSPSSADLSEFDVVYLAALVGISQSEKEEIMLEVVGRMRKGALLVARSSWGLRTCLYPEVDLAREKLLERLEICVVVHPYGGVVNSVVVARVR